LLIGQIARKEEGFNIKNSLNSDHFSGEKQLWDIDWQKDYNMAIYKKHVSSIFATITFRSVELVPKITKKTVVLSSIGAVDEPQEHNRPQSVVANHSFSNKFPN